MGKYYGLINTLETMPAAVWKVSWRAQTGKPVRRWFQKSKWYTVWAWMRMMIVEKVNKWYILEMEQRIFLMIRSRRKGWRIGKWTSGQDKRRQGWVTDVYLNNQFVIDALYWDGEDVEVNSIQEVKYQKFCVRPSTRGLGNRQVEMPWRKWTHQPWIWN